MDDPRARQDRSTPAPPQRRQRPAVAAAVLFVLGIASHSVLPHRPLVWLTLLATFLVLAFMLFRREQSCAGALAAGLFLAGALAAQLEAYFFAADDISAFAGDQPRLAQIELEIGEPPRVIGASGYGEFRALPPRQIT